MAAAISQPRQSCQFLFCLMKNPLLYRSAWPESSRGMDFFGDRIFKRPFLWPQLYGEAFCRYANRRLPTEADWECAAAWSARERKKRRYPWGETAPGAEHAYLESGAPVAVDAYREGDSSSGCRQLIGNTWEWTESSFDPYPGFVIDPYQEYSQPWFGTHKVLRGASFATTRRLVRNTIRNFYTPERNDIFA